jgi:hypothetical protein
MPRVQETTVYQFDELSDSAKEAARDWFRQGNLDYEWYEFVFDDVATIADLLGIDLRQTPVKLIDGTSRMKPSIMFSGFYSQGDGACFEGTYSYKKGSVKSVRDYAPDDTRLHRIAEALRDIQRPHFYKLEARVKHSGHYCHEFCTQIAVDGANGYLAYADAADAIAQTLREFMHWIYRRLESEYEYLNSDESVDESIRANEYEFEESGARA